MRKEISNEEDWIVEFETNNEKFFVYKMNEGNKEEHGSYDSYENAQKAIDRAETIRKRKIVPLPFIKQNHWESVYKKGKITSIAEIKSYGLYVWTSVNKSRSKEDGKQLKDIPENEGILQKIQELKKSIINEEKKLVYYTEKELKEHFKE